MTREQWQTNIVNQKKRNKVHNTLTWGSGQTFAVDKIALVSQPFMRVEPKGVLYLYNVIIDGVKESVEYDLDIQTKTEVYDSWYSFLGFGNGKTRQVPWSAQDYFKDKTEVTKGAKENYKVVCDALREHKKYSYIK